MKIAIVAPSDKTFIAKLLPGFDYDKLPIGYAGAPFIGTIIQELLDKGNQVIAITTTAAINNDYTIKEFYVGNFKWIVIPARKHSIRFNGNKLGRILDFYAFEQNQIQKVIIKNKPDFVHAHWSYEFAGAVINIKIPHLVTIHDNPYQVLKYFKNLYRFGRLLLSEWVLKKVKFASTVSPYMSIYAHKKCNSVKVIPNPTVIASTLAEITKYVENRCNTLTAPRLIMIMNGWDNRKNGRCGLLAFQLLKKEFPKATLHLFGNGTEINREAFMDAKSLSLDGVYFNGPIPHSQLINELQTAHLLIHPALEESFGVVLIEAMALGVPAIGGLNSGGVPWVIGNQELLVDVKNPSAIKDKIMTLLSNHEVYRKTSLKCYQNTLESFSAKAVVTSYLDYYNEIIKKWN